MLHVERFDHTADIGIRVKADTPEDVFKLAAHEMFKIICTDCQIGEEDEHTISIKGDDYEDLLVNWLSELNFLFQTENFLLSEVTSLVLNKKSLHAKISTEAIKPDKHQIHTEIKAVTYHKLFVKKINRYWQAQVIFDI